MLDDKLTDAAPTSNFAEENVSLQAPTTFVPIASNSSGWPTLAMLLLDTVQAISSDVPSHPCPGGGRIQRYLMARICGDVC